MTIKTAPWIGVTAALGVVLAVVFLLFPQIDLVAGGIFYLGDNDFLIRNTPVAWFVRNVLRPFFTLASVGLTLYIGWRLLTDRPRRWLLVRGPVFVAVCLIVGPGLLANAVLKENWGRARPKQVVEFAGERRFTPPLIPTDQCDRNCSFVSGDASFAFTTVAIALLAGRRRRFWVITALSFGLAVGALRMMNGSHFFSDVLFGGVFMTLTTLLIYRWMIEGRELADPGRPKKEADPAGSASG